MSGLIALLVSWAVMTVSFVIISKLPIGVEIESLGKAVFAAAVFGILNTVLRPILDFFGWIPTVLTLGLFSLVINAIIFGLAASLVDGFRLKSFWSALIGALLLSIVNGMLFGLVARFVPGLA